eukprot:403364447
MDRKYSKNQNSLSTPRFSQMADGKKLQVRNRRVAQQILDSIEQLESEPDSVKRWIWELLQNAQDSAIPGCKDDPSFQMIYQTQLSKALQKNDLKDYKILILMLKIQISQSQRI